MHALLRTNQWINVTVNCSSQGTKILTTPYFSNLVQSKKGGDRDLWIWRPLACSYWLCHSEFGIAWSIRTITRSANQSPQTSCPLMFSAPNLETFPTRMKAQMHENSWFSHSQCLFRVFVYLEIPHNYTKSVILSAEPDCLRWLIKKCN